jgi:hypothetical protein
MMSNIEEEIQKAEEERDEERHKHCQLREQLEVQKIRNCSWLSQQRMQH